MNETMDPGTNAPAPGSRALRWVRTGIAVVVVLAAWGIVNRVLDRRALAKEASVAAVPSVIVRAPESGPTGETLTVPGSVMPFVEAPIYARTNGYLRAWHADIGAKVRKGQLLAEIDSPEVDQQLRQAAADLAMAEANAELARTTNERWKDLLSSNSVSQQDADAKAGDAAAKIAAAESARANVARLRELESFKRVVAPFDGVVIQRNTDIGALINAGQNAGASLFRVADIHRLRVYVQVPEPYARFMRPGVDADVVVTGGAAGGYPARIVRTAEALDPGLRTLQVELEISNANELPLAGAYAEARFHVKSEGMALRVPINTLLFHGAGLQVATVAAGDTVHLKSFVAGRDFGTAIEALSGLDAGDRIIVNPPDSIAEGMAVRVVPATPAPKAGAAR